MRLRADALIRGTLLAIGMASASAEAADNEKMRYEATGRASWYGDELRGRKTANGERFDPDGLTAAHRTLPFHSHVEVTALDTGRTILVRINDRGPFHGNRIIDLSHGAARQLGIVGHGAQMVRLRRIDAASTASATLRGPSHWSEPKPFRSAFPVGSGPYFIRVATFSAKSRAQLMARRMDAAVFKAGGLYQVRLGPYADRGKLNAVLAPLAAKGYPDALIIR